MTYQALLQYAKEHEMTVKDFNCHKLNGGIAQLTKVDVIKTFKCNGKKGTKTSGSHRVSGQSTRDSKICSKCNTTHQFKDCPSFGKNAINVVLRIILAHVVDLHRVTDKTQTNKEVEHQHMVEALRDITDLAETGAPDPDHVQGVVHKLETPIALKLTNMILMILMYLTLFTVFPGQRQLQLYQTTQTQMVK